MKACKNCYFLTDIDRCPKCSSELSKDWKGYLIVVDYANSEIAKKMNININGKYALSVK